MLYTFLSALISSTLFAGGLEFPAPGTVGAGRGGAFTAKADNASAFIYNPAGLANLETKDLLLSIHLVHQKVDFSRKGTGGYRIGSADGDYSPTCNGGDICIGDPALDFSNGTPGTEFDKVSMSKPGVLPTLIFNYGNFAHIKGLSLSAGLITPVSFGAQKYPENGAQRYTLIDSNHLIIFPGIGVAYRFNKYFQLGAVFMSGVASLNQTLKIRPLPSMASTSYNENLSGDASMEIKAVDPFIPTGIIGIKSEVTKWLELGVSVKLPAIIAADGTFKYTAPSQDMSESYMEKGEDKVTLKQKFPLRLRAGARYVHSRFDIEADFVYENWKSLQEFSILPDAIITDPINDNTSTKTPMPDTKIPKNFRDTYSARLGGDFAVWKDHLNLRAGAFYQSSAYPKSNNTFNIDFPYGRQIGVSGGLSFSIKKRLDIHAAYMHIFQPDITVKDGIVQQQGLPLSTGEEIGNTINNGTYKVALNIFSLAVEAHF
ncbi:MAG: outer membrane protein transport protein [Deltaproteobacteria bacterium]|nr:outer membrane protein transport protein [Deltaproteobacteria bacterium]